MKFDVISIILFWYFKILIFTSKYGCAELTLGCGFVNDDFRIPSQQDIIDDIRFGDEMPVLRLNDESAAQQLINRIATVHSEVMSQNVYDDVDEFYRFYQFYEEKRDSGTPFRFARLYNNYPMNYNTDKPVDYTLVIEAFKRLRSELHPYLYLSTVYENVPEEVLSFEYYYGGNATNYYRHDRVAGVLKFQYGEKRGHILIDPAIGMEKPVVLLNDRTSNLINDNVRTNDMSLSLLGYMCQYTYLNRKKDHIVGTKHVGIIKMNDLYYIKKPYCSILTTTAKLRILKPFRKWIKRNNDGLALVFLTLYFFNTPPSYKMISYSLIPEHFIEEPFSRSINTNRRVFEDVAEELDMTPHELGKKLEVLYDVAYDSGFLRYLRVTLSTYLNSVELNFNETRHRVIDELEYIIARNPDNGTTVGRLVP